MSEEALLDVGFSKNEAKIYRALVELGPSMLGTICGKTKIHRRNVYDCLEMLKEKGFICATIINNRNVFEAIDPQRLMEMIEQRNHKLLEEMNTLLSRKNNTHSSVKVYTGQAGRKVMFEEKLKEKGEQYVLGAHNPSPQSRRFVDLYHHHRAEKGIRLKMLFSQNESAAARLFSTYKLVQARLLPKQNSSPIAINIYGTKTALLLGSSSLEPLTIIINDVSLAKDMTSYFNLLWQISKPLVS